MSEATYDELISQNGMIWLSSIPVAVAFTAIATVVLVRMIRRAAKRSTLPLPHARKAAKAPTACIAFQLSWCRHTIIFSS